MASTTIPTTASWSAAVNNDAPAASHSALRPQEIAAVPLIGSEARFAVATTQGP